MKQVKFRPTVGIGLSLLLCACLSQTGCGSGQSYGIEVHNRSAKVFDSVEVYVDADHPGDRPIVRHGSLLPGQAMPPTEVGQLFTRDRGQLPAMAVFYAADTVVRSSGPQEGGTIYYARYKITIDSSLRVTWAEQE